MGVKVVLVIFLFIVVMLVMYLFVFKKKVDKEEIKYQLNELKKSKALMGTLSIIIAIIICFVLTPSFNATLNKKIVVIETIRDIKIGEKITDNMIREIEVGAFGVSNNIIKSREELKDKYATKEIGKAQYIYKNSISEDIPYENQYLYTNLTGLNRAISFTTNKLSNGLSNKLMQGDIISIIVINNQTKAEEEKAIIPEELKYVEVLTTTNNDGKDIENIKDDKNEDDKYLTITVLVCDEQAKLIAKAETTQQIYVELVYRPGNQRIASYLLNKQQEVLNDLYPNRINREDEINIKRILSSIEETTETESLDPIAEANRIMNEAYEEAKNYQNPTVSESENNGYVEYIETSEETSKSEVKETLAVIETETETENVEKTNNSKNNDNKNTDSTDIDRIQKEELKRLQKEYGAD